jgi:hypothetical protein
MSRQWYVTSGAKDQADLQPARLHVCATYVSAQAVLPLGEVWVDYEVVLSGTKSA